MPPRLLSATNTDRPITIRLKRYKDQAEATALRYGNAPNVTFEIADSMEQLVEGADVVVSCITDADGLMVGNVDLFQPGVLVVPVHTRGFQNCDRVFDKVYADDEGHVSGFRYFNEFRSFAEIGQVLKASRSGARQRPPAHPLLQYRTGAPRHFFARKIITSGLL